MRRSTCYSYYRDSTCIPSCIIVCYNATQGGTGTVNSGFTHYPHHLTYLDSVAQPKEAPVQFFLDSPTIPIT